MSLTELSNIAVTCMLPAAWLGGVVVLMVLQKRRRVWARVLTASVHAKSSSAPRNVFSGPPCTARVCQHITRHPRRPSTEGKATTCGVDLVDMFTTTTTATTTSSGTTTKKKKKKKMMKMMMVITLLSSLRKTEENGPRRLRTSCAARWPPQYAPAP